MILQQRHTSQPLSGLTLARQPAVTAPPTRMSASQPKYESVTLLVGRPRGLRASSSTNSSALVTATSGCSTTATRQCGCSPADACAASSHAARTLNTYSPSAVTPTRAFLLSARTRSPSSEMLCTRQHVSDSAAAVGERMGSGPCSKQLIYIQNATRPTGRPLCEAFCRTAACRERAPSSQCATCPQHLPPASLRPRASLPGVSPEAAAQP